MGTIRQHLAERDRDLFVARHDELSGLEALLDEAMTARVVHLVGPAGIGKSALLREFSRRATARGFVTTWIDGRDIDPFPADVVAAFADIGESTTALIVFDSYELVSSLDSHLRDRVVPELPESSVVVFASRQPPSRGWYEHGWHSIVRTIEIGPLDNEAATSLLHLRGVDDPATLAPLIKASNGLPLALVVGAEAGPTGNMSELAARLLGDEVDPAQHRILSVAAIARVVTPELLADALALDDPSEEYKWLAGRSFSEPLARGLTLHAVVAGAVRAQLRERDPVGEGVLRRRIADHLHRHALAGHHGLSTDLQHLIVDPAVKWGYAADIGNRFRIDTLRPGDTEEVGSVLAAVGADEWWRVTRVFFDQHPDLVGVARSPDGRVGGYFVAVSPQNAPAAAHDDVLLGPWLAYATDRLRTNSAVLWREAVDLTGELGEVTSLLGAGGLLSTGVANPRYLFLPIAAEVPAARAFSERLGAEHVAELDLHAHGMDLECHIVDFGSGGLIGNQRDWIYRETGVAPPVDVPEIDPAELLRWLREPSEISHGPAWLGSSPSQRLDRLNALVEQSLMVFGTHRDDQLARSIIEAAYLGDNAAHEAIARRLHLSRSAYFRRLHSATLRVGEELDALVRRGT